MHGQCMLYLDTLQLSDTMQMIGLCNLALRFQHFHVPVSSSVLCKLALSCVCVCVPT